VGSPLLDVGLFGERLRPRQAEDSVILGLVTYIPLRVLCEIDTVINDSAVLSLNFSNRKKW